MVSNLRIPSSTTKTFFLSGNILLIKILPCLYYRWDTRCGKSRKCWQLRWILKKQANKRLNIQFFNIDHSHWYVFFYITQVASWHSVESKGRSCFENVPSSSLSKATWRFRVSDGKEMDKIELGWGVVIISPLTWKAEPEFQSQSKTCFTLRLSTRNSIGCSFFI